MLNRRFLLAIAFTAVVARGESAVQQLLEEKLIAHIRTLDESMRGVLGVAAIDLTTGRTFAYHGDAVFPTASSIKIPILIQMFQASKQGEFRFTDPVTIAPAESVGGSGNIQNALKNGPVRMTVLELITAMIRDSDNTATNKCIAMAKMDRVNRLLEDLGFHATRLRRIMMDSAAAERGDENTSSPTEMSRLVELLYRAKVADAESSRHMLDIMKLVKADMRRAIPANIAVASKPGDLDGVHCETAVVYLPGRPFVLSVFSTFLDENANPVGDVTKLVFEHFNKLSRANEYGHFVK